LLNIIFESTESVGRHVGNKVGASIYKVIVNRLRGKNLRSNPLINSLNQKIQTKIKSNFAVIEGSKMNLSNGDPYHLSIGLFEPLETKLVKNQVKKGFSTVDIGASIGFYTLLFSKRVGNNGKVFSFEPNQERFTILSENIKINNYQNIVNEKKVVSDSSGLVSLNGNKFEAISLDDYFQGKKIDFIKVDVDGFEKKVIDGAISVLENNKNIKLMMEYYPPGLEKFSGNPISFVIKLESMGFEIFDINQKMKQVSPEELANSYPNSKNQYTNLFIRRP